MLSLKNIIIFTLIFPICGIILLLFTSSKKEKLLKRIALTSSCFAFINSLILWESFQKLSGSFQFILNFKWLPLINLYVSLGGVDSTSLFFVLLTTFLIPLCLLASCNIIDFNLKEFLIAYLFLYFLLIVSSYALDLLVLYEVLFYISSPSRVVIFLIFRK
jgi:NADH-quinone oxidoreductase subunit M